jgi:hypothetical protein
MLFFFIAYINIVYLFIGTNDCIHFLRNAGFQHSIAISSATILMLWLAFKKIKSKNAKGENNEF